MSWEINVTLAKEINQVGSILATWTDPSLGVFPYSRNCRANLASADAFISEAIMARDAWQTYQAENNTKAVWVLDRLNTADPEVI